MRIVKTYCKICNSRCGILAHAENGKIKKIKGDPNCKKNRGALCVKGSAMLEFLYDAIASVILKKNIMAGGFGFHAKHGLYVSAIET